MGVMWGLNDNHRRGFQLESGEVQDLVPGCLNVRQFEATFWDG